jgi:hypothetical protein
MKRFKIIIAVLISIILPFSFLGCSKSETENDTRIFVGIAIYQKLNSNLNWSKFSAKPNAINNIVSTKDDKIVVDEEPELLFYVYTQNEITSSTTDKDFISNTTKDTVTVRDSAINFRFERMIEDTEILIYYIYKLEDNTYYLEYQETKTNIKNETESFEFNITHSLFSKINLTLETNLSIKKEY